MRRHPLVGVPPANLPGTAADRLAHHQVVGAVIKRPRRGSADPPAITPVSPARGRKAATMITERPNVQSMLPEAMLERFGARSQTYDRENRYVMVGLEEVRGAG
ncbi:hypothetical protein DAERI_140075 [Deinococcus aerius]|uniref:Uncharacterized protein n=1 Tax=Deinococcus aerius TaxID=200253 RepID=A0A2I9CZ00_9DEIO|nr:hypothetical protein DAERI_140075 [Deinococcus aerius]